MVEEVLRRSVEYAALVLETAAALTILVGAIIALYLLVRTRRLATARLRFAQVLLLALDLTIGADVLKVALVSRLEVVATVAGVVGVRVVLTLLVMWEISRERTETA